MQESKVGSYIPDMTRTWDCQDGLRKGLGWLKSGVDLWGGSPGLAVPDGGRVWVLTGELGRSWYMEETLAPNSTISMPDRSPVRRDL